MPLLVGCLALLAPRLTIFFVVLMSDFIGRAYATTIWPLLGFFFLPLTTLAYAAAINWHGEASGGYFALVLLAALIDLGLFGRTGYTGRRELKRRRDGRIVDASFHD